MLRRSIALATAMVLAPCLSLCASEAGVLRLIAQLGDEDWETREEAEKQLVGLGDAAREALKAAETHDLEVRMRIAGILEATATCENVTTLAEAAALRARFFKAFLSASIAGDTGSQADLQEEIARAWTRIEQLAPAADRDLSFADLHFEAGSLLFSGYSWSRRNGKVLALANIELDLAVEAYDKFLEHHPGRVDIEERQRQALMYLYGARKMFVIDTGH